MFRWCQQPTLSNEKARIPLPVSVNLHLNDKTRKHNPPTRKYIQLYSSKTKSKSREFGIQTTEKEFDKPNSCITFNTISCFRQRGIQTEHDSLPSTTNTKATHSKINLSSHHQSRPPSFQSSRNHKKDPKLQWSTNIRFDHGFLDQSINKKFPPNIHFEGVQSYHYKVSEKSYQQKPTSEFFLTPKQMKIILDKDTVISRQFSDEEEGSFRVEESVILEPEMKSKFIIFKNHSKTNKNIQFQQAFERQIKLLVTVKEVPLSCLKEIRQESRVYEEMESRRCEVQGVLSLYQTYIHKQSCLLIKEPFFKTFSMHLLQVPFSMRIALIHDCLAQIYNTINCMAVAGFGLCSQILIEDIVVSFNGFLIQNMRVFSTEATNTVDVFLALQILKGEMITLSAKFIR